MSEIVNPKFNIKLGWKPSAHDPRDYKVTLQSSPRGDLP